MENDNLIFVYGTLMRDYNNNHLLEKAEFIGKATTTDRYTMLLVGFPVLLEKGPQQGYVQGEIYRITGEEMLKRLDRLESEGYMYNRTKISVQQDHVDEPMNVAAYIGVAERWQIKHRSEDQIAKPKRNGTISYRTYYPASPEDE